MDLSIDPENRVAERASVPNSKERGFAAVVEFLTDWKWEDGLFVPLYGRESSEGAQLPPSTRSRAGVWRISTEVDREGNVWTLHGPDVMVAHRVRALAKATWSCLHGMEEGKLDVKVSPPLQKLAQFDPLIVDFHPPNGRLRFSRPPGPCGIA
jgi:U3 small nucleolar RNA-associated protein 22